MQDNLGNGGYYVGTMQQLCAFLWQFREGRTFLHSFPVGHFLWKSGRVSQVTSNESSWLMFRI